MERRCPQCVEALEMFVTAYGAEAGNLALRAVATAGVYVGGGIAPQSSSAPSAGWLYQPSGGRSRWRISSRLFPSP